MTVLVTGNMGYVGPTVVAQLWSSASNPTVVGLDTGYFAHCLTGVPASPERLLDRQLFRDVRHVEPDVFEGVDAVVHLAAISNDPIGHAFEQTTHAVNHKATERIARLARDAGVRSFVFASSCSVYGAADGERSETSPTEPLTPYALTKQLAEESLRDLAAEDFVVTSLRFATACGLSDRLRLDLVLNDFVASAIVSGKIILLSDGTPWRPLIHVRDMARAVEWALGRHVEHPIPFLVINVGSRAWNYRIGELAHATARAVPGVEVEMADAVAADGRSYRVDFSLFEELAPEHQPRVGLEETVLELAEGLRRMGFHDVNFRDSELARLTVLRRLVERGLVDNELRWAEGARPRILQ